MTPTEARRLASAALDAFDPDRELDAHVLADDGAFWLPLAPQRAADDKLLTCELGGPGGVLVDRATGTASVEPTVDHLDRIEAMRDVTPGVLYFARHGRLFAMVWPPSAPDGWRLAPGEWRLDPDGWTELEGAPVLGWRVKGDVDLDDAELPQGIEPPPFRLAVR